MQQHSLFLAAMVLSGGTATVLLRQAVVNGLTDEARFYRAFAQTVCIVAGIVVVLGPDGLVPPVTAGSGFAALNGAFGGLAFIFFTKGLETVEASTGKPALVVSMVVAVLLGIVVLGEAVTVDKLLGLVLAGIAIYLLTSEG
jgi:transporter family protein